MNFYKKYNGYLLFDDEGYKNEDGKTLALHLAFEFYEHNKKVVPLITFKLKVEIQDENFFIKLEDHEVIFNDELKNNLKLIVEYKYKLIAYGKTFKNDKVYNYIQQRINEIEHYCQEVL